MYLCSNLSDGNCPGIIGTDLYGPCELPNNWKKHAVACELAKFKNS